MVFGAVNQAPSSTRATRQLSFAMNQEKQVWTKKDLIRAVAAGSGLDRTDAETAINGFLYMIGELLKQGKQVELWRFGSFRVQERAARMGRNPATNTAMEIPARRVPVFRAASDLKARISRDPEEES